MKTLFLVGTAIAAMSAPAMSAPVTLAAQEAAPDVAQSHSLAGPAPSSDAKGGLADIIVTAQRRAETAQRAAVAIDVVSPQELTRAGVVTATMLNATVPALTVQQGGGANTTFFVRGVGNFTNNGYSDPAIAFNLDGIYLGRPTSTTGTFFDLERIEVLKGPQGTLYGRNATGGAINVIPAKPRLGERSLSVSGSFGNYDAIDAEAAANLPIGDNAAIRIAGKVVDRKGYNEDGTSDEVGQAVRAQLLIKPSPAVSIRLSGDYSHQGGAGVGASYVGTENFTPGTPATSISPPNYSFTAAGVDPFSGLLSPAGSAYFGHAVIPGTFINPAPLASPYLNNRYWGLTAEINADVAGGTLTILPSYRRAKLDNLFNGPSFRGSRNSEDDRQFSTELRFQGPRLGPIDWLVGGYYFNETVKGLYGINQYQIISFQDFTSKTKSYAAFGRVTAHLSDRLRFVAAGRYTHDGKDFNGGADTLIDLCTNAPPPFGPGCFGGPSLPVVQTLAQVPGAPAMPGPANAVPYGSAGNILFYIPNRVNAGIDKGRVTYRLAAEYDLAPASLLYASYETGYRSGGFSNAPGHETFEPEYVEAWTIGSKNRFFDRRLQFNVELFHWRYRNQQVSHYGLDANNSTNYFTENIGRSTIKGVDVEAQWLLTPTTRLSGTVQYLDARVKRYTYNSPRDATSPPPAVGCAVTPTTANGAPVYAIDCAGKPSYNSPRWSLNGGIEKSIALGAHKIVLNGDARYRSNSVIGFEYLPQQNSGAFWTFDASATFGAADDHWAVTGFVRNLTDKAVPLFTQFVAPAGGVISSIYAPPRTYGLRVRYTF